MVGVWVVVGGRDVVRAVVILGGEVMVGAAFVNNDCPGRAACLASCRCWVYSRKNAATLELVGLGAILVDDDDSGTPERLSSSCCCWANSRPNAGTLGFVVEGRGMVGAEVVVEAGVVGGKVVVGAGVVADTPSNDGESEALEEGRRVSRRRLGVFGLNCSALWRARVTAGSSFSSAPFAAASSALVWFLARGDGIIGGDDEICSGGSRSSNESPWARSLSGELQDAAGDDPYMPAGGNVKVGEVSARLAGSNIPLSWALLPGVSGSAAWTWDDSARSPSSPLESMVDRSVGRYVSRRFGTKPGVRDGGNEETGARGEAPVRAGPPLPVRRKGLGQRRCTGGSSTRALLGAGRACSMASFSAIPCPASLLAAALAAAAAVSPDSDSDDES